MWSWVMQRWSSPSSSSSTAPLLMMMGQGQPRQWVHCEKTVVERACVQEQPPPCLAL